MRIEFCNFGKSVGHCSYWSIETWMEDVLQVPVSRGYLATLCTGTISDLLKESYDDLTEAISGQELLGSGKTSHKHNGKKHWIWCITAAAFSLYHNAQTHSRDMLERLAGRSHSRRGQSRSQKHQKFPAIGCCPDSWEKFNQFPPSIRGWH